ncbi:DUF1672 domain-containing protein [Bacillus haynesii]|uniref:DUF1672 family protein n=1 Tax=Bacillus haynesii TaxID=1925021 RepID=UPI00228290B8|nr:DUF1672 family protein [Bacillus haynesii]MCY8008243.1 DUF1672 domain-containing protein [Bacillus haynesii]MCY8756344.1 DUF1672 domain-containing protein [Bacillus haynesii]MCY9401334.1 DUF1672 domain-containing protein [Bacillus haynesii]MEC0709859.1 DUF1672 family protein [Bacillus haynesii]MEC0737895.1 DUF1672 family protein [Bacillus haynesii]
MKFKKIITLSIGIPMLLGGCMNLDLGNHDKNGDKTEANNNQAEYNQNLIRVQDYTGQGYALDGGQATAKIAEAHHEEIEKAVKAFFLDKYKTKVKVHNIVGALNAASVFVESEGEPHFHTNAVVPIDVKKQEVKTDKVWSQEGQVEDSIIGGIYAMAFEKELQKLDHYLEETVKNEPVVGTRQEAINNTDASGFSTTFYYLTISGNSLNHLYLEYLKHPDKSKEEWKKEIKRTEIDPKSCNFNIQLYMEKPNTEPNKGIFNRIVNGLEDMEGLPPGAYSVYLSDNTVDKRTAVNSKQNTLERAYPNYIIIN